MPQNMIEVQSALQDPVRVTMNDLMKYANDSNPDVPAFLALIEMNRRKSIQQNTPEENVPSGTVKDQTINALLGRQEVNPAAAPAGVNPTAAPQAVDPTMMARQVMPQQAAPQVNPGAMVQAARGGLMSIPMNMFKAQNYAAGGIVAFAGGGDAEDEFRKSEREYRQDQEMMNGPTEDYRESERKYRQAQEMMNPAYEKPAAPQFPPRQQYKLGNQTILGPRSQQEIEAGLPSVTPMRPRPEDMTIEQAAQRRKEIMKAAGVAEDPYAEAKQFQKDLEARQAKEREGDPVDRLLAMARSFAKADPTKGFGYQAASASEASASLEATQKAIREKQDAVSREFRLSMAKEDDARRRGDADGIAAALTQQKKEQADYDKLQLEYDKATQARAKLAGEIRQTDISESKLPIDVQNALTQQKQAEAMAAHYKATAGHQKFLEDEAKRTRPEASDILRTKIMARAEQDPMVKALSSQLKDLEIGSDEYNKVQAAIYNILKTYFAGNETLAPPAPAVIAPPAKKNEPGFFSRLGQRFVDNSTPPPGGLPGLQQAPATGKLPPGWSVRVNP